MATAHIDGFDEFRKRFRQLPEECAAECEPIIDDTLKGMKADVQSQYALGETENLVEGVKIERDSPLSGRVRTTARHAHLYELGTVKRFTKGSGANRGVMPSRPVFIPAAIRWRDSMFQRIKREVLGKRRPELGDGTMAGDVGLV